MLTSFNFRVQQEKLLEAFNDKKTKKSRTIPRLEGKMFIITNMFLLIIKIVSLKC